MENSKSTVFALIRTPGAYLILRLLELERAYFKIRESSNIKCQNLVILSFKVRIKYILSLSISQI